MFRKYLFHLRYKELHPVRVIFTIYTIGFLYGTKNHIQDIIRDGLGGYLYVPLPVNIYWTSLTVLDPLVVILLIYFPFWGMSLAIFIMASDITVNSAVTLYYFLQTGMFANGRLGLQIAFGLFVFLTVPFAWKRIARVQREEAKLPSG